LYFCLELNWIFIFWNLHKFYGFAILGPSPSLVYKLYHRTVGKRTPDLQAKSIFAISIIRAYRHIIHIQVRTVPGTYYDVLWIRVPAFNLRVGTLPSCILLQIPGLHRTRYYRSSLATFWFYHHTINYR